MAALDFPSSPVAGQIHKDNGRSWRYSGISWIGRGSLPLINIADVPNKVAWYKADALAYANNDQATTFTDSSGNGRNLPIASDSPTFKTNIINGLPAVRFDGNDYYQYGSSLLNGLTSHLIIIVGVPRDHKFNMVFWPSNTIEVLGNGNDLSFSVWQGAGATTYNPGVKDSPYMVSARVDGGFNTVYNNGLAGPAVSNAGATSGNNPALLGAGQGVYHNGDVAEVLVIAPAPTLLVQRRIEATLRAKYALPYSPATPTSPTDLTGLMGWFDANALALSDNDAVNPWTDMSGNGNHATTSHAPTFKTNILNSKPVVRFSGDRLHHTFSIAANRRGFSIIAAFIARGDPPGSSAWMSNGQGQTTSTRWAFAAATAGANGMGWAGTDSSVDLGSSGHTSGTAYVEAWRKHMAGWVNARNGAFLNSVSDTSMPSGATWNGVIGQESMSIAPGSPGSYGTVADLAEILVFDRYLSQAELDFLEDLLGAKWGVTIVH